MSAQSEIQVAIDILKNSADSRVDAVKILGVPNWEGEPAAKAIYEKEIEAIAGLESAAIRFTALEAQSAELLAALERMLAEFGGDTGGIGAKGRCEAICAAREASSKATGSAS